jgi:hypothetical protein
MSDNPTSTILACPVCGGTRFSWTIHAVQFGTVHDFDGTYGEEATKLGPITGSDVDENGVFCVECKEDRDHDDLVPHEEETS